MNVDTDEEEEEREKSHTRGRAPMATELKRLDSWRTVILTSPEVVTLYRQREEAKLAKEAAKIAASEAKRSKNAGNVTGVANVDGAVAAIAVVKPKSRVIENCAGTIVGCANRRLKKNESMFTECINKAMWCFFLQL